jgi:hypothetical protein
MTPERPRIVPMDGEEIPGVFDRFKDLDYLKADDVNGIERRLIRSRLLPSLEDGYGLFRPRNFEGAVNRLRHRTDEIHVDGLFVVLPDGRHLWDVDLNIPVPSGRGRFQLGIRDSKWVYAADKLPEDVVRIVELRSDGTPHWLAPAIRLGATDELRDATDLLCDALRPHHVAILRGYPGASSMLRAVRSERPVSSALEELQFWCAALGKSPPIAAPEQNDSVEALCVYLEEFARRIPELTRRDENGPLPWLPAGSSPRDVKLRWWKLYVDAVGWQRSVTLTMPSAEFGGELRYRFIRADEASQRQANLIAPWTAARGLEKGNLVAVRLSIPDAERILIIETGCAPDKIRAA